MIAMEIILLSTYSAIVSKSVSDLYLSHSKVTKVLLGPYFLPSWFFLPFTGICMGFHFPFGAFHCGTPLI